MKMFLIIVTLIVGLIVVTWSIVKLIRRTRGRRQCKSIVLYTPPITAASLIRNYLRNRGCNLVRWVPKPISVYVSAQRQQRTAAAAQEESKKNVLFKTLAIYIATAAAVAILATVGLISTMSNATSNNTGETGSLYWYLGILGIVALVLGAVYLVRALTNTAREETDDLSAEEKVGGLKQFWDKVIKLIDTEVGYGKDADGKPGKRRLFYPVLLFLIWDVGIFAFLCWLPNWWRPWITPWHNALLFFIMAPLAWALVAFVVREKKHALSVLAYTLLVLSFIAMGHAYQKSNWWQAEAMLAEAKGVLNTPVTRNNAEIKNYAITAGVNQWSEVLNTEFDKKLHYHLRRKDMPVDIEVTRLDGSKEVFPDIPGGPYVPLGINVMAIRGMSRGSEPVVVDIQLTPK